MYCVYNVPHKNYPSDYPGGWVREGEGRASHWWTHYGHCHDVTGYHSNLNLALSAYN